MTLKASSNLPNNTFADPELFLDCPFLCHAAPPSYRSCEGIGGHPNETPFLSDRSKNGLLAVTLQMKSASFRMGGSTCDFIMIFPLFPVIYMRQHFKYSDFHFTFLQVLMTVINHLISDNQKSRSDNQTCFSTISYPLFYSRSKVSFPEFCSFSFSALKHNPKFVCRSKECIPCLI